MRTPAVSVIHNDLVRLPIQCASCGGLITLHFDSWRYRGHQVPRQNWKCPHCRGHHCGAFSGTLRKITRGHGKTDE